MTVVRYRVPAPGSAWTEQDRVETALLLELDGAARPHTRVRTIRKRVEVFGATPRVVTRARVAYLEHLVVEQLDLTERRRASPLQGKTFVLDATGGALTVTGPDGAPVAPDDDQAVRVAEKRFGRGDSLPMVLAQLEFRAGEAVDVPPALAARLFGGEHDVTQLALTFVEHRANRAHFTMVLRMTSARAGSTTETAVAGTLEVETDTAQLCEMRLAGTVHVTGATSAEGTVAMLGTRTPG
ncbi:MAG TPA: hypothetical protein VHT91_21800 [Kofleriaceae bacterium]|jgi:hypothetical protein|nr:hypothetical protein [Kofleriaceae bacterium]